MKIGAAFLLVFFGLQSMAQLKTSAPKPNFPQAPVSMDSIAMLMRAWGLTKEPAILQKYQPLYHELYPELYHAANIIDSVKVIADSVNINPDILLSYIDPHDIVTTNILKNKQYPWGVLHVTLKNHALLLKLLHSPILSLNDIVNTYTAEDEKHKPIIFILNRQLVTDTLNLRIPEMCLNSVTIAKSCELPYFKIAFPDVLLMMITTRYASNEPRVQALILR